ncbi:deoxyribonuclease IV [Candidatus Roizmanbacteria bacterium]|nr:deoxyribonuclease IV [Candidatus Roizmanbacteria bacterium]
MTKLGAHVSITGGYTNSLQSIHTMGGNCLQIFSTSPRGWNFAKVNEESIQNFRSLKSKLEIGPVYFHASYLINLSFNDRIAQLSKQFLKHELNIASKLGIKGSIIHLGSFKTEISQDELELHNKGYDRYGNLTVNIKEILGKTPQDTLFIIENAGNNKVGKKLDEIATIIEQVDNDRVRACLDTCHLYSSGYDLSTNEKLNRFLETFDSLIGLKKLEVFHFNDSRDPFESGRDRHENIGKGTISIETFRLIMTHPKLKHLPFIIEVPGFEDKGPDKKNLDILKNLLP